MTRQDNGEPNHIAGVILTGGMSLRMGSPKAMLPMPDGKPILSHVAEALIGAGLLVYCVGICPEFLPDLFPYRFIPDMLPNAGPMGGIATILQSGIADGYIIVGCDQPFLTPSIVTPLMSDDAQCIRLYRNNNKERLAPLPGYYPARSADVAFAIAQSENRSVHRFIEQLHVEWVTISSVQSHLLRGVNTPNEYARIRE
ncbi:MAG: molybdenum cofactor guanylyltransferase [bacterium]|nr:molybdenum cofactor guanylyltransferase [bacterium]